jgi:hypothetical protein
MTKAKSPTPAPLSFFNIVNALSAAVVLVVSVRLFSTPLRANGDILGYAQDDFYYYLVIARNLVHGLGSTFDGTTRTNGYHPLYLVTLWGAYHFVTKLRGIFLFLAALDTLSAMTIFLAARAFFAKRLDGPWLPNGFALVVLSICFGTLCHQMEVTLTLPLGMLFLLMLDRAPEEISGAHWGLIGLVASLLVLSRLDAVLLVGLCGLVAMLTPAYRRAMTGPKLLAFAGGFAPLLLGYVVTNEVFFGRLTPISGAAKQLKLTHGFDWHELFTTGHGTRAIFALSIPALLYLAVVWGKLARQERVVYTAALLFPFLHWALTMALSDWQLWPWYTYSSRFALLGILALASRAVYPMFSLRWRVWGGMAVFALSLLFVIRSRYQVGAYMMDIAEAARGVAAFAQTHPGRYAMGDRAGMVGYLNGEPTMQTEGLMMDSAYLVHIARQDPLRDVLNLYNVDYYVGFSERRATVGWKPVTGCFQAREPAQAGPASPTMKGVFCEAPAWQLIQPSGQTMIFALRP